LLAFAVAASGACMGEDGPAGPDGLDGISRLAFTWSSAPYYIVSDYSLPATVYRDSYFLHPPGFYDFGYQAWDGSVWTGWYEIDKEYGEPGEPGEKGGMFWKKGKAGAPGANGRDFYLMIGCWSFGPTFDVYWDSWWLSVSGLDLLELAAADDALKGGTSISLLEAVAPAIGREGEVVEQRIGEWRVRYSYRRAEQLPDLKYRAVVHD
jgi:hypothetical protein